ncbi:MAG: response regulator [Oculatellaceae cyanobacterium bins.114]|nr:response regulator [Oculatellaceae cyanobacterium bins.114]
MISYSTVDISHSTVLIVDDERNLRLMLCRAMEMEKYQVLEASTGDACLTLCQQQIPDIILLDAMMPRLDGFDCCEQLHQYLGDRCPPILMITALSDLASVDRAFASGAIDFVTKPIHWAVLRHRVRRILQMHRAIAELRSHREQPIS